MSLENAIRFAMYLKGLAAGMPADGEIRFDRALADSGVVYEEVQVQMNRDYHRCLFCQDLVTSVTTSGINRPCGHSGGTLVVKKAGGA